MAPTCPLPEQAFVTLREAALELMQAGAKAEVAARGGRRPGKDLCERLSGLSFMRTGTGRFYLRSDGAGNPGFIWSALTCGSVGRSQPPACSRGTNIGMLVSQTHMAGVPVRHQNAAGRHAGPA